MDSQSDTTGELGKVSAWLNKPFSSTMSVTGWVLFLGLVLCASAAWTRLIAHFE
jgi:hypothetical protein